MTAASACPACTAASAAEDVAGSTAKGDTQILLSLPEIHCAGCIAGVERALCAMPGVRSARVNLTLKRATVEASDSIDAPSIARALTAKGYTAHELDGATLASTQGDTRSRDLLMRLGVAGFAMMNVMLLSVAVWSGAADATRDLFHWISAAIALPTIAFSAQPFFRNAWDALKAARLNMDVPISLAILLAAAMSVYETMQSGEHAYFDAALSLTFFLLAGRYLDHRTRSVARSAAQELAALEVPRALRIDGAADAMVPIADLAPGDLVRVLPGARVPVDGLIEIGNSEIDRSLLTGESLPVFAGPGTTVSAGEVNLTGAVSVRVTAAGEDSTLHRLADLVALAETARNRYTSLADRAARIYAPAVHLLALGAFIAWVWISGDVRLSLNIAVAVLIITCPCALGLAVPAVTTAASGRLFRQGMLIKNTTALERLAEVDTVVFDKTGTLTEGRPQLADPTSHDPADLALARALARGSSHPLATALSDAGSDANSMEVPGDSDIESLREIPGHGVEAEWRGQTVRLGRAAWVGADPVPGTATYLQTGGRTVAFRFSDALRDGAADAVTALKAQGKTVILLSGDHPAAVADIAARTGIDAFESGVLPDEKALYIKRLRESGHKVLMVGDGLNDTAALAAAHASISPASALEATRVVSDIVLLGGSLAPLADAVATSKSATRRIVENFAIAAGYNAIAIPIALIGLATPLAAALAMSFSSISVTLNALRLR
ncbi:MAG: heavy metal translocating P-type ATPase [Rhodobacter sp.]|nr:heavy metal translocating P-type ATPase [Rhodobacter sp.]